jgi:hypothetical protein
MVYVLPPGSQPIEFGGAAMVPLGFEHLDVAPKAVPYGKRLFSSVLWKDNVCIFPLCDEPFDIKDQIIFHISCLSK